jgi:hypothetical protein
VAKVKLIGEIKPDGHLYTTETVRNAIAVLCAGCDDNETSRGGFKPIPLLLCKKYDKEEPVRIHVESVAHLPVTVNTRDDDVLKSKGSESKVKSAT